MARAEHALELVVRSNALMRRFEMNWLDEDLVPINLRALKVQKKMYESMVAVRVERALRRVWGRGAHAEAQRARRGVSL